MDTAVPYSADVQTFTVKVATKDSSHPYFGVGSSNGYKIDDVFAPYLQMIPRNTYRFDQSDSTISGHPLRFYLDASKGTQYTTGVTTNGTPGQSGAYTQIVATDDTLHQFYIINVLFMQTWVGLHFLILEILPVLPQMI